MTDAYDDHVAGAAYRPDVALVNFYSADARLGMHQDRAELAPDPVVSLSLGSTCVFRLGSTTHRGRPWTDVELRSGDLVVFGRSNRLAYHGVPHVEPGTGDPDLGLAAGERINVTLRVSGFVGFPSGPPAAGRPQ